MTKYLSQKEILSIIGEITIDPKFSLMSQDSYHEELIAKKINTLNKQDLCHASLNLAIVGYGNQKYGQFRQGDQLLSIATIFQKNHVKYNNAKSALLKEDDITAQRLCRFFRYNIRDYILNTGAEPYLWRKYSPRNPKFRHICFRGAEYIDELNEEESEYLYNAVKTMDERLSTNVSERIIRVYDAKKNARLLQKLMPPQQ